MQIQNRNRFITHIDILLLRIRIHKNWFRYTVYYVFYCVFYVNDVF